MTGLLYDWSVVVMITVGFARLVIWVSGWWKEPHGWGSGDLIKEGHVMAFAFGLFYVRYISS